MSKKKKLSRGQLRRVQTNHQKKLHRSQQKQPDIEIQETTLGPEQFGTVISRFGQHADIEIATGDIVRCNIRRTILSLVCGDKVIVRLDEETTANIAGVVEAVHPRSSTFCRPDLYDGVKTIAANIDQILIVTSILPAFSTQIIDRYIVAAEDMGITPIIIVNKIDLITNEDKSDIEEALNRYQAIGYSVYQVSSILGQGLEAITALLKDKVSIFAGQSGVGKSSLINALLPSLALQTGDVSENSGLGQHTTTTAKLVHFPNGGDLIDSPGVREFALWHLPADRVAWCFKELRNYLGGCKFRDCTHKNDPGCALQEALKQGDISQDRFDNYHRIIASLDEQRHARQFRMNTDD